MDLEIVHAENPGQEVWLRLRYFASEDNCRTYIQGKKKWAQSKVEGASREISAHVRQAEEFFRAAASVSHLTSPLLYFYGIRSLGGALVAALSGPEHLPGSHGLKFSCQATSAAEVVRASVTVTRSGLFPKLASILGTAIPRQTEFALHDFLCLIPEISTACEKVLGLHRRCIKVRRVLYRDRTMIKTVQPVDGLPQHWPDKIPGFRDYFLPPQIPDDRRAVLYQRADAVGEPPWTLTTLGERYFVLALEEKNHLLPIHEIAVHYAVMYSLGMLVRYYPLLWKEVAVDDLGGAIFVFDQFIDQSARKFPNMVLNLLEDTRLVFTAERARDQDLRAPTEEEMYEIVQRRRSEEEAREAEYRLLRE